MIEKKPRTLTQNASLHLWCTHVAQELEAQGIERHTLVEDLAEANIPITMDFVKHVLWYHFMKGMYGIDSTTQMTTDQVSMVERAVTRHLIENYGLQVDWPSNQVDE